MKARYSARNDGKRQSPAFLWAEMFRQLGTLYGSNWDTLVEQGLRSHIDVPRKGLENEPVLSYSSPFAFKNEPAMSMRQIARELNLSTERVRQIIMQALLKLRFELLRLEREEQKRQRAFDASYRRKQCDSRG